MNCLRCKICDNVATLVGEKRGKLLDKVFQIFRCPDCGFVFVANPWTDFEKIYSQQYYEGKGVDPLANYVFELEHPDRTIRKSEWQGLLKVITTLLQKEPVLQTPMSQKNGLQKNGFRWLDYGCGNGGLVRFARQTPGVEIYGFEEGWIADKARRSGIPLLDASALEAAKGSFDVVTAIEVMEHVLDPLETLRSIRRLLKPGGLFFCTTGNARKHRNHLLDWPYVIPEIHVSFFEPGTLEKALTRSGFRAEYSGFVAGHAEIIQARTLKNLGARTGAAWHSVLRWPSIARVIDFHVGFTGHPVGWAE